MSAVTDGHRSASPPAATPRAPSWRGAAVAAALAVAVLLAYGEVRGHGFVNIDDQQYVYANPVVARGLTLEGVAWAFTTTRRGATGTRSPGSRTCSTCELFGLDAGAHHLVERRAARSLNACCSSSLLAAADRRRSGASALVGGALRAAPAARRVGGLDLRAQGRPLDRVPPAGAPRLRGVRAWKPLALSLSKGEPSRSPYLVVVALFALGLMAKPMLVTFPALLLLLDAWPLRRLRDAEGLARPARATRRSSSRRLPLLALSAVSVVDHLRRAGGRRSRLGRRADLPAVSASRTRSRRTLRYLELTFWPSGLAVFYPHPVTVHGSVSRPARRRGAVLVVAVTRRGAPRARARPHVLWGWLWYLGTLVPVIGLVQVGSQAMADRYTYVPLIGVFVSLVWGAGELVERLRVPRVASAVAAVGVIIAAGAVTHRQVSVWRDSIALHSHAVRVTEANWKSLTGLSDALSDAGRFDEAIRAGEQAVRIHPAAHEAWASLGATYGRMGRHADAVRCLRQSLTLRDDSAAVWYNLGTAYGMLGDAPRAADCFVAALRLDPDDARTWANLGIARLSAGDLPRAVEALDALRRLDPQRAAELKVLIERAGG